LLQRNIIQWLYPPLKSSILLQDIVVHNYSGRDKSLGTMAISLAKPSPM
jgi:hypothetical protein